MFSQTPKSPGNARDSVPRDAMSFAVDILMGENNVDVMSVLWMRILKFMFRG